LYTNFTFCLCFWKRRPQTPTGSLSLDSTGGLSFPAPMADPHSECFLGFDSWGCQLSLEWGSDLVVAKPRESFLTFL